MSLIPAFEIGVWNVWIFTVLYFLPWIWLMFVARERMREMETSHTETERRLYPFIMIPWFLALIYSIFLPLRLGTIWFYVGLPISIVGLIALYFLTSTIYVTAIDKKPLTGGLYRYSRHPYYLSELMIFVGVGVASASWVFLLFSILYSALHFIMAITEERFCLNKYGDPYREYMNRTPRWIGIPKSEKKRSDHA